MPMLADTVDAVIGVDTHRDKGKSDPIDAHLAVLTAPRLDVSKLPTPRAALLRPGKNIDLPWVRSTKTGHGGHRCGMRVNTSRDIDGIVSGPGGRIPHTGAGLLYRATQGAVERVTGSGRYPPPTGPCGSCSRQVTDRADTGRPIHIEHGHAAGCARLDHDQAADTAARRTRLPAVIAASEPAAGGVQWHQLTGPVIDDCPRYGWHGYFL